LVGGLVRSSESVPAVRGQFVPDAQEQGHLLALNFTFRGQHLFQLGKGLRLVDARLLGFLL
jgi:hypothetical protein